MKKMDSLFKGLKSKTTTTKKKEQKNLQKYGEGKLDHSHFPLDWLNVPTLPLPPVLSMNQPYCKSLPKIHVCVHKATGLTKPNAYVKITIGSLQSEPIVTSPGKKTYDPEWNEEFFRSGIEDFGLTPFLCTVTVFGAKTVGTDTPIGTFQVDLFTDLGMRVAGDYRRFDFPLNTQGFVTISFKAQTDLLFPEMDFLSLDGLPSTICLPFYPNPIIEFTVHQALFLHEEKRLQTHFMVQLLTYDFNALPGVRPEKTKLLLKSSSVKGNSPFWGEKCETSLYTNKDSIRIVLAYTCGKKGSKEEQVVKVFEIEELKKLATATETRRWLGLPSKFQNGLLGVEIRALSNMQAVEGLPEPPGVLSVEEWNERQKNGGRHAIPSNVRMETLNAVPYDILGQKPIKEEEDNKVGNHISDLLMTFNQIPMMGDDETQNTLFVNEYESAVRKKQVKEWEEVYNFYNKQMGLFEVEMGRVSLVLEKKKAEKEAQDLQSQWNKFNDERLQLFDGSISSIGNSAFRSDINSLLQDISLDTEVKAKSRQNLEPTRQSTAPNLYDGDFQANRGKRQSVGAPNSAINSARYQSHQPKALSLDLLEDRAIEVAPGSSRSVPLTVLSPKRNGMPISPRSMSSHTNPISKQINQPIKTGSQPSTINCTICKASFDPSAVSLLRGKPFCIKCKERLLEGAKQRGMKI